MATTQQRRIRVLGNSLGVADRTGTVMEEKSSGAVRVRWDDGTETTLFPGSDCIVEEASGADRREHLLGCHVEMQLTEDDDRCEAIATLMTRRGAFQGVGTSRRNPNDPVVPMIGEELAIARALEALAAELEIAAQDAIDGHEADEIRLI